MGVRGGALGGDLRIERAGNHSTLGLTRDEAPTGLGKFTRAEKYYSQTGPNLAESRKKNETSLLLKENDKHAQRRSRRPQLTPKVTQTEKLRYHKKIGTPQGGDRAPREVLVAKKKYVQKPKAEGRGQPQSQHVPKKKEGDFVGPSGPWWRRQTAKGAGTRGGQGIRGEGAKKRADAPCTGGVHA